TIHNLGYQGIFPAAVWPLLDLDWSYFTPRTLEFYGQANLLKGGIVFADALTTVSRRCAEEILTPEYGNGLDGVLPERREAPDGTPSISRTTRRSRTRSRPAPTLS